MNKSDNRQANGIRLGAVIRRARLDVGLSIRQLAERVGVHHSFISRLESGDYTSAGPQILQRLSRVLELDERDLFALTGQEAPEGLPAFTPYLRAKYEMSDEAAQALKDHWDYAVERFGIQPKPEPPQGDNRAA